MKSCDPTVPTVLFSTALHIHSYLGPLLIDERQIISPSPLGLFTTPLTNMPFSSTTVTHEATVSTHISGVTSALDYLTYITETHEEHLEDDFDEDDAEQCSFEYITLNALAQISFSQSTDQIILIGVRRQRNGIAILVFEDNSLSVNPCLQCKLYLADIFLRLRRLHELIPPGLFRQPLYAHAPHFDSTSTFPQIAEIELPEDSPFQLELIALQNLAISFTWKTLERRLTKDDHHKNVIAIANAAINSSSPDSHCRELLGQLKSHSASVDLDVFFELTVIIQDLEKLFRGITEPCSERVDLVRLRLEWLYQFRRRMEKEFKDRTKSGKTVTTRTCVELWNNIAFSKKALSRNFYLVTDA